MALEVEWVKSQPAAASLQFSPNSLPFHYQSRLNYLSPNCLTPDFPPPGTLALSNRGWDLFCHPYLWCCCCQWRRTPRRWSCTWTNWAKAAPLPTYLPIFTDIYDIYNTNIYKFLQQVKLNTNQLGQSCTVAQVKKTSCGAPAPSLVVIKEFKTSALVTDCDEDVQNACLGNWY